MEKTVTKEQVLDYLTADKKETLEAMRGDLDGRLDQETVAEMVLEIMDATKKYAAEYGGQDSFDAWTTTDRILWLAKESYVLGFLKGAAIYMDATEAGINALFG